MDGASPAHVLDGSSDRFLLPPGQRNFRLIDAERIASDRLKDAPEGSLKEALATTIVEETAPESASLTERLADVGADIAASDDFAALRPFQAGPDAMFGWMDAVPPAHTVPFFEAPEEIPQAAAPIVEAVPVPSVPVAASAEPLPFVETAPIAEPMVAMEPAAQAEPETDDQQLALNLLAPEHALDTADASAAMPAVDAEPPVDMAAEDLLAMEQAFTEMATAIEERARNELGAAPHDAKLEPIVTAFAASARLAADATAASQALHHLKRLLADQLVEPEHFSEAVSSEGAEYAATAAAPQAVGDLPPVAPVVLETPPAPPVVEEPMREAPVRADLAPPPVPRSVVPPSIPSIAAVPRATSLPLEPPHEELPQIVSKARVLAREPARDSMRAMPQPPTMPVARAPSPPILRRVEAGPPHAEAVKTGRKASRNLPVPVPAPAYVAERTPFDLRGFCTGFVLSGAIGLLLYFVMTAS